MSGGAAAPIEAIKLSVEFVKQVIAISAQLATFVSGGIYFLRTQKIAVAWPWYGAIVLLFMSISFGLLSFGAFIGQLQAVPTVHSGRLARRFAMAQNAAFFLALLAILFAGSISLT